MKVVAYVPIKLNNSRTPGKNIKQFDDGTPLCNLMFNTLTRVKGIDEIYCFCSSEEIKKYLPDQISFLQRSKSLDTAQTQCQDLIRAFTTEVDADIYVLCHVTSPFVKVETIEKCLEAVLSGEYDSAFTGASVREFLWENGKALNFDPENSVRTQELPNIYKETVGCYVFKKEVFEKRNGKVGYHPYICEVDEFESMDIDYPNDFAICNAVYMNILRNSPEREQNED
jgi:CMP-N-acetylneuraminic acid synthetase